MTNPRNHRANARGRPFEPGNPGKPIGTRNRATAAAAALRDGEAEGLTRKAIDMAREGDTVALRICLERPADRTPRDHRNRRPRTANLPHWKRKEPEPPDRTTRGRDMPSNVLRTAQDARCAEERQQGMADDIKSSAGLTAHSELYSFSAAKYAAWAMRFDPSSSLADILAQRGIVLPV